MHWSQMLPQTGDQWFTLGQSILTVLVGGLVAAVGTVGGVVVTLRHTERQATRQLWRDQARIEAGGIAYWRGVVPVMTKTNAGLMTKVVLKEAGTRGDLDDAVAELRRATAAVGS